MTEGPIGININDTGNVHAQVGETLIQAAAAINSILLAAHETRMDQATVEVALTTLSQVAPKASGTTISGANVRMEQQPSGLWTPNTPQFLNLEDED